LRHVGILQTAGNCWELLGNYGRSLGSSAPGQKLASSAPIAKSLKKFLRFDFKCEAEWLNISGSRRLLTIEVAIHRPSIEPRSLRQIFKRFDLKGEHSTSKPGGRFPGCALVGGHSLSVVRSAATE